MAAAELTPRGNRGAFLLAVAAGELAAVMLSTPYLCQCCQSTLDSFPRNVENTKCHGGCKLRVLLNAEWGCGCVDCAKGFSVMARALVGRGTGRNYETAFA